MTSEGTLGKVNVVVDPHDLPGKLHRKAWAFALVENELDRATEKFGRFNSGHEGYAVILEELDELWEEVKSKESNHLTQLHEATQVAAMAIRFMIDVCGANKHE